MCCNQGLEPFRKEPVLKPEHFQYWEPKPLFKLFLIPDPYRNRYFYLKNILVYLLIYISIKPKQVINFFIF